MKIAFITIESPFGKKESYISTEISQISFITQNIIIFPLITRKKTEFKELENFTYRESAFNKSLIITTQLVHKFNQILKVLLKLSKTQSRKRFFYSLYLLPKTLLLIDLVEKQHLTHIHAYWGGAPATCALIVKELTGVKFSFSLHRADIEANDILALKSENAVFVRSISEYGMKKAIKNGVNSKKIEVIHLGVKIPNLKVFIKKNKILQLITVSSLISLKRISLLVRKLTSLPDVHLTIIGEGPELSLIRKIITKCNLKNQINIFNQMPNKEVLDIYTKKRFDLFILPSSIEGIPVSAMEAMAHSIPVALTNVGGVNELINKECGYFLKKNLSNLGEIIKSIPNNTITQKAFLKVKKDFNVDQNSIKFIKKIKTYE